MKKIVSICLFCLSIFKADAQISGFIFHNNNGLEYVTVSIVAKSDNILLANTVSDSNGHFEFNNLIPNSYLLSFNLLGYAVQRQEVLLGNQTYKMDTIFLSQHINLNALKVIGQKKTIQKTQEGFIVNADANITQAGGTATDILKNTPTISVDADGAITMRGKTPLIFINGKASIIGNPNLIPASSIESIEIINNASAKYNANAESGIINIKLKKNKMHGTNGAIVIGAGYGAKPRFNSSVLINHKAGKWNLGIGYDNRFAGRTKYIVGGRTNFLNTDVNTLTQIRKDNRVERLQNLRLSADYTMNEKNAITFELVGSREGQDNYENLNSIIKKQNNIFGSNTNRNSAEIEIANAIEFSSEYTKKFTDDRKNLSVTLATGFDINRQNTGIISQALQSDNSILSAPYKNRTHNYENGNVSNLGCNYAVPLSKKAMLETGYLGTYRGIVADYESANLINNEYQINTGSSNVYTFNEMVNAVYALYNNSIGDADNAKWKYNIGARAEQVNNRGNTKNNSNPFSNNYLKIFPTASLVYQIAENTALKISYGKRINRPSLEQLNPFKDITDTLNPHSGNPYLLPEIIHAIEFGYSLDTKKVTWSSNVYYRYSINAIRGYLKLQPNGANLILPVNIGTAIIYGWENVATIHTNKWYDANTSVNIFQQNINGSDNNTEIINNAFGWNSKLINNIKISNRYKLQIIGNYNSAVIVPQGSRIAQYYVDLGYQQKLGKGNARLGITMVDVFNSLKSGYQNSTTEFRNFRNSKADTRAIMLTYAYTFKDVFKEKLLDNQFSREY